MKLKLYVFLVINLMTANLLKAQNNYIEEINQYRDSLNKAFAHPETSILKAEYLTTFKELPYFPVNEKYRIKAKFIRIKNGKTFEMLTSTSRKPVYTVYGKLVFKIDDKTYELYLYKPKDPKPGYENWLFCPFTDLTNGEETYGGGRYLDFTTTDMKNPVIDFNMCYNPYCAYNDKYSCPVPPKENFLNLRIEAGVKKLHD